MIQQVFAATLFGFTLAAVLMALGNRGIRPGIARDRWKKLAVYFLIVHATLACAAAGRITTFILLIVIIAFGASEIRRALAMTATAKAAPRYLVWSVYVIVAATALLMVPLLPSASWVYLYLLVAMFDGFSQVVGQLVGRRPLAPGISPAKTIEGAVGGLIAAIAAGLVFRDLVWAHPLQASVLGLAISAAGLCGDLAASMVKRRAGLKNFGQTLPGHGGVLDRFDSFLVAAALIGPIIYLSGVR